MKLIRHDGSRPPGGFCIVINDCRGRGVCVINGVIVRVYRLILCCLFAGALVSRAGTAEEVPPAEAEGSSFKLAAIKIDGNKYFADRRIRDMLAVDKGQRYDRYLFDYLLEKGLKAVAEAYKEEGFADIEARWAFRGVKADSRKLAVLIREGKRVKVEDILVDGVEPYEYLKIREGLDVDIGAPLSASAMASAAVKITRHYADRGYARAKVDVRIDRDARTVTFTIDKGECYYVDKVLVAGNKSTRARIVSRELDYALKPHRLYRVSKLDKARARIYGTGLYRDLTVQPVDTNKPGKLDLLAVVREDRPRWYKVEPRYTSPDMGGMTLGWGHNNIMGNNQRLSASVYGDYAFRELVTKYGSDITYTEPWLLGYRYKGTLTVFYDRRIEKARPTSTPTQIGDNSKELREAGVEPKIAREITEELEVTAAVKVNWISGDIDKFSPKIDSGNVRSFILTGTYDGRNDLFNPLAGSYLSGYDETAGGILGGDYSYWKVIGDARHYIPVGPAGVFGVRARSGRMAPYGATDYPPNTALFFTGGAFSVRGYGEGALGPTDEDGRALGGTNLLVVNAELRFQFPFTKDKRVPGINLNLGNLWAGLFFDGGNVWSTKTEAKSYPFGYGTGVGVRYNTPVGPLRFDYGWPILQTEAEQGPGHFYIAFGHIF